MQDSKLVFGLDLGINNVGWCALRRSPSEVEILAAGTYVFDSPLADENKPQEGLKSRQRGSFRRARRTARRRRQRKMGLYRLLAEHGFLPRNMKERVALFCKNKNEAGQEVNPYALRAAALERPLTPYELGRAICHLNQKRGFISPRDIMFGKATRLDDSNDLDADEEARGMKLEIQQTEEAAKDFPTIGAFLNDRLQKNEPVRKKKLRKATPAEQKQEDLRRYIRADRHMIEAEFWKIMEAQQQHHPLLTHEIQHQLHDLIFNQRILAADAKTRGCCNFYKKELRMPRASLTAQKFTIAQEVAHLEVAIAPGEPIRKLHAKERKALVEALMNHDELKWSEIKTLLNLTSHAQFNIEPEMIGKKRVKNSKSTKDALRGSQTVSRIKRVIGDKWEQLGEQAQRDIVSELISIRDWVHEAKHRTQPAAVRRRELFLNKAYGPNKVTFSEKEANELATVPLPEGYLSVSLKAAKKLLPHLLDDKTYDQAMSAIGFDHANPDGPRVVLDRLPYPTENDISHAIVRTSVRGAVRILNCLHQEYGKPDHINIELPRDLAKNAEQREEDSKRQLDNERERTAIMKELMDEGLSPKNSNIKKVRLWGELGGAALPYEPDIVISDIRSLINGDYEIDHIVPRGHGLDTTMANLTLCTREFNTQWKANKTPYEAMAHRAPERWKQIEAHVRSIKQMPLHKRNRILSKTRPEEFTERHLNAIGYISKEVLKLAQQMVKNVTDVVVMPGKATSLLRKFWELENIVPLHPEEQAVVDEWKAFQDAWDEGENDLTMPAKSLAGKNRSNFKHHALDAIVVALSNRSSLQAVSGYYQQIDSLDPKMIDKSNRKLAKAKAMPDPNLRQKVCEAIDEAVVVHRPQRRPKGELHKQMPVEDVVQQLPNGAPWGTAVVGKYLVKYDHDGKPAQAYPLGNNHHVVIWERTEPNKKGEFERAAEVVPTIDAMRRLAKKEPVIRKHRPEPGWKFVMALCKGDMVEMADGTVAVVSKFSAKEKVGDAVVLTWHSYVAQQHGKVNTDNPYVVAHIQTARRLREISKRIVMNPLGEVVYREGLNE